MAALLLMSNNVLKLMSIFNNEIPGQTRNVKDAMKKSMHNEKRGPETNFKTIENVNLNDSNDK